MSGEELEYGELDPFEPLELTRSERFELIRPLGEGGMGRVYLVHDRTLDAHVALKTLARVNPANLYRFKKEFRSLANVSHPNLVVLHELVREGDAWFLTMEYVEGREFLEHVQRGATADDIDSPPTVEVATRTRKPTGVTTSSVVPRVSAETEVRLRDTFAQLATGVQALHAAGKLHKDLKASNVLVTYDGRVVLLDFGMVDDRARQSAHATIDDGVFGTPAYMPPEQAAAQPCHEPGDWYSFGAMLYEALTGQLPIDGTAVDIITRKQVDDPPAPSTLVAQVPHDLEALCMELLQRDPAARPTGPEVLARLRPSAPPQPRQTPATERATFFVGRGEELRALDEALAATTAGKPVVVSVEGPSGIGKSALVRRFARRAAEREQTVVLHGRCHERESVPFKAIDSLIDALVRYLGHLPDREVASLLPRHARALARMFPVLHKLPAFQRTRDRRWARDRTERRRRGFSALKELFGRLSDRVPLVLWIDDVQWGDADSTALLSHILGAPDPAAVLVVATRRRDDRGAMGVELVEGQHEGLDLRRITLQPLSNAEARELALQDLAGYALDDARLDEIARESGGNPFFVGELVHTWTQAHAGNQPPGSSISLEEALQERIAALSDDLRGLLQVIAVAGQPLPQGLALAAAGLTPRDSTLWSALRSHHLVHSQGPGADDSVECLHARIRDTVTGALTQDEVRSCHRKLAAALSRSEEGEAETIAFHYRRAGDDARAAQYLRIAAETANDALAFQRAAELYRNLLAIGSPGGHERSELERALGDALASAGRGGEAAEAYLRARDCAPRNQALELERLAAEHFLRSGHVEEGLESLERVLSAVGMRLPSTPARALLSLLLRRARVRLRGLRFTERALEDVPADLLIRIDTCWSASSGLGLIDFVRGGDFQTRHLHYALQAGEPVRVVRALALEVGYLAAAGSKSAKQTARLVETAETLAARVGDAHALGLTRMAHGMARWQLGHWREGLELCTEAEQIFRERCAGVAWEVATAHVFQASAQYWLGDLPALARDGAAHLREARDNGDLFAASDLQTGYHVVPRLARDDAATARAALLEEMRRWTPQGFHLQHWNHLEGECLIDFYEGEGEQAYQRLTERWRELEKSLVLQVQVIRVEALQLRAHCALATAAMRARDRERLLSLASGESRQIQRLGLPWARGLTRAIDAAVSELRGEIPAAREAFEQAAALLKASDMRLHADCARYRLARLLEGEQGQRRMAEAAADIAERGVTKPERIAATIVPGF